MSRETVVRLALQLRRSRPAQSGRFRFTLRLIGASASALFLTAGLLGGCGASQGSPTTTTATQPPTSRPASTTTSSTPAGTTTTLPASPSLAPPQNAIGVFALDQMVWTAEVLPDGGVLLGTETGLIRWNADDGTAVRWTMLDGLPFNDIRAIATVDDELWLTSGWSAIARYDGADWSIYDEGDGLAGPWPYSIATAHDGTVWVGDYGTGLSRFDGVAWTTVNIGLASLEILDLEIGPDGALWVGTWEGLSRISPNGEHDVVYRGEAIHDVAIAPNGDVWYDTWNMAIQRHSIATGTSGVPHVGPPGWSMRHPVVTPDGDVWAAVTSTGDEPPGPGFARYEGAGTWTLHASDDQPHPGTVTVLEAMPDGSLLAGTTVGAFWFRNGVWTRIDLGAPSGISAHWIEADGNDVWIGSDDELILVRDGLWHGYAYPASPDEGSGPVGVADGTGGAWIGTIEGLAHFDGTRWTEHLEDHAGTPWTDYGVFADEIGFVLDWRMAVTPDGALWVTPAARAAGLWRFFDEDWTRFDEPAMVTDLAVAGDGTLYVLTHPEGEILTWSGDEWDRLPDLPYPAWNLASDRSSALITTEYGIYSSSGTEWQHLGLGGVWRAHPLPDGSIWASTEALFRYDGYRWIPTVVGDSPSSTYLVGAAQTTDGATWLLTGLFVYRYPPGWHWPGG